MTPGTAVALDRAGPGRAERDTAILLDWLRDYVGAPSEHLGRSGPVCPFVPGALRSGALRISFHYGVDACDADELGRLLAGELCEFRRTATPPMRRSGVSLDSRLVVLPDAAAEGWRRIDETYDTVKDGAVAVGLMIGQFHPECTEPAVHNPTFPVSRSPMALYAIRHMAPHDALFLRSGQRWMREHEARFPGCTRGLPRGRR